MISEESLEQNMGRIEEIILRHSQRGMLTLRKELDPEYCTRAAEAILSWKSKSASPVVYLTTGFYVAGYAETDGPVGTAMLALALSHLGFEPVILTDKFCEGFFEPLGLQTRYLRIHAGEEEMKRLIDDDRPAGMISIERCGINSRNDYENMRGISIKENTAPCDEIFRMALLRGIPTVGVGDGGNEIGMGNVQEIIAQKLSLVPCIVKCTYLVIASVSNWGAYGLCAALSVLTGRKLMQDIEWVEAFLNRTVAIGSVDGVTHERIAHVDGYDETVEKEIVTALLNVAEGSNKT